MDWQVEVHNEEDSEERDPEEIEIQRKTKGRRTVKERYLIHF